GLVGISESETGNLRLPTAYRAAPLPDAAVFRIGLVEPLFSSYRLSSGLQVGRLTIGPRLPCWPARRYYECHAMRFFVLLATVTLPALASEDFAGRLYPVLEKAQCRLCHNDNGVASTTRLQFPRSSATPEEIDRFGLRLRALVDRSHPEESLLLRKPTNRVPHTGGQRI